MKKLILFLFIILPITVFSQKIDDKKYYLRGDYICDIIPIYNGKVSYYEVVSVDNVSKEELYQRARTWFANTFNSSQEVIQFDDPYNGKIIGKGSILVSDMGEYVKFSISISVKDNRYKYELYDFFMLSWSGLIPSLKNEVIEKKFEKVRCNNKKDISYLTVINRNVMALIDGLNTEMK